MLENVCKSFKKKEILHHITLKLDKGIYGLLGPNGAGKTTLMRCLVGLYEADSGEICMDEELKKRGIGYLPQSFGLHGNLTVYENLEYLAALKKVPDKGLSEHILNCIETVNLTEQKDMKCKKLSGGMLRRLGIAQTLLGDPGIIILDEPTVGLDPEERLRMKQLMRQVGKKSMLLISTHIVEDMESLCDEVIIMNQGSILKQGSQQEILRHAEHKVYTIPVKEEGEIDGEYSVLRSFQKDGQEYYRLVCEKEQDRQWEEEVTLEDAYICLLKGFENKMK
ncbi:MAG: ATP-binding cassette domain-containing protein [Lachnospiraceae bacterium]|nr:ATP-binding cassette domain-containing protein [Lachnospiraceae bacterium]